jgi:hypothetical protein
MKKLQQKQNGLVALGLLVLTLLFGTQSIAQQLPNNINNNTLGSTAVWTLTEATPSPLEILVNLHNSDNVKEVVEDNLLTEGYVDHIYTVPKGLFVHKVVLREHKVYQLRQQQWVVTKVEMFVCNMLHCDAIEFIGFQKVQDKLAYMFLVHDLQQKATHMFLILTSKKTTMKKVSDNNYVDFDILFDKDFDFKAFVAALNNVSADKLQTITMNDNYKTNNDKQIIEISPQNYYDAVQGFIFNNAYRLTIVKEIIDEQEMLAIEDLETIKECFDPTSSLTKLAEKEFCAFTNVEETEYDNKKEVTVLLTIDETTCVERISDYEIDFTGEIEITYTLTKGDNGGEDDSENTTWCFEKINNITIKNETGTYTFSYENETFTIEFDFIADNPATNEDDTIRNTGYVSLNPNERVLYFSLTVSDASTDEFLYKLDCYEDNPLYFEKTQEIDEIESIEDIQPIPTTGKVYLETAETIVYENKTTKVTVKNYATLDFDTGNIETAELYVKTVVTTTVRGRTTVEETEETKEVNISSGLNQIIDTLIDTINN